jgi:hypothetical protein
MVSRSTIRCALSTCVVALVGGVACSATKLPYAGGLMLAVQTDLAAPKDVAAVGLYITSDGRPVFGDTRDVAPNGEVKFPATIAVLADADRPRAVVKIRAVAFKANGDVRVLRDIITTIPKGRTGLLRAPLLWINEGSGSGNRTQLLQSASLRPRDVGSDGFSRLASACPDGETYLEGECADAHVDGDALPDYTEKDVFGGGDAQGGGRCFDVLACFDSPTAVAVDDQAACSATIAGVDPNDPNLSFAVSLPATAETGECANGTCLVPLDKGIGWRVSGAAVVFPRALCRRIAEGKAKGIVASRACPTKDATAPSCGPASSVSAAAPGVDAGGSKNKDFETPFTTSGEPRLSNVAVDTEYVYVTRSEANPPPSGLVRLTKADVTAQKTPPEIAVLFGYGAPQASSIALDTAPSAAHIVVRGESSELRLCTPKSANDCALFNVVGPPEVIASSPQEAFAFGEVASQVGLFSFAYANPTPTLRPVLPGSVMSALRYASGALFIGLPDASLYKCDMPCNVAANVGQLRAPPATPAIVTAIAASDKVPGKIFFLQVPADGVSVAAGGVFELDLATNAVFQLAGGAELGGAGTSGQPPTALAVDSEYVYWGGGFDDTRAGGTRKAGLLERSHRTRAPAEPLFEDSQGVEPVSGVAVDDGYVYWTYDRADRSLMLAKKRRAF